MYRGKGKKLLHGSAKLKAVSIENHLFIQVNPIINSNILFVERSEGTEVVLVNQGNVLESFIHPFIKPSSIINSGSGKLIPEKDHSTFKNMLSKELEIEFFDHLVHSSLSSVEKPFYVDKTWDITRTLVFDLIR